MKIRHTLMLVFLFSLAACQTAPGQPSTMNDFNCSRAPEDHNSMDSKRA